MFIERLTLPHTVGDTRLIPKKYSIENDTKVQMIHFDL